jgi:hypothetical protein
MVLAASLLVTIVQWGWAGIGIALGIAFAAASDEFSFWALCGWLLLGLLWPLLAIAVLVSILVDRARGSQRAPDNAQPESPARYSNRR